MPQFHCIHCGQHIDAPEEMKGTRANCPSCEGMIDVPGLKRPNLDSTVIDNEVRRKYRIRQRKRIKLGVFLGVALVLLLPIYMFFMEAGPILFVPVCLVAWLFAHVITEEIQKKLG